MDRFDYLKIVLRTKLQPHLPINLVNSIIETSFNEVERTDSAILQLKAKLQKGIVLFQYKKVSGEIRTAAGTLKEDFITVPTCGKSTHYSNSLSDYVKYFDVEKQGWRSFKVNNFLEIVSNE